MLYNNTIESYIHDIICIIAFTRHTYVNSFMRIYITICEAGLCNCLESTVIDKSPIDRYGFTHVCIDARIVCVTK